MRLSDENPASSADWLVTMDALPDTYWQKFSGVVETISRPTFADGLSAKKRKVATGTSEYDDVTLSKSFDPEKDGAILAWADEKKRSGEKFGIVVRPVKRNKDVEFRGNKSFRISGAQLIKISAPAATDSAGGDQVSMVELVFSVEESVYAGS